MEALLRPNSISPKISTILQSHVYPRVGGVLRALAKFKSLILDALGKTTKRGGARRRRRKNKKHEHATAISCCSRCSSRKRRSKQVTSDDFVMKPSHHLAWSGGGGLSSSAAAEETLADARYHVYPSLELGWNVVVPVDGTAVAAAEYCGYLRWLEDQEMPDGEVLVVEEEDEEVEDVVDGGGGGGGNEIDRLAEKFIARCRANFLLEKQESYDRRCQEMIARSM